MSTIDILEQRRNRIVNTVHTWLLAAGSLSLLAVTVGGRVISAGLFVWGLRPYRQTVAATAAWQPEGATGPQPLNPRQPGIT